MTEAALDPLLASTCPKYDRALYAALLIAAVVGMAFVFQVPPGLPYDEPSHWTTVLQYRAQHAMPLLGNTGVTYEAQHPPLPYVLAALVLAASEQVSSSALVAFRAVRILGGVELLITMVFLDRLLRRFVDSEAARFVALATFGTAPVFVAMGWSVQNDTAMLMFGFASLDLTLRRADRDGPELSASSGLLIGLVVGLSLLSKLTAWLLLPVIGPWIIWRTWPHFGRALRSLLAMAGGISIVIGWWFVYNLRVYGTLIGDVAALGGPSFSPAGYNGPISLFRATKTLVTYFWLPTDYFRNMIAAPAPIQVLVGIVTAGFVIAAIGGLKRDRTTGQASGLVRALRPGRADDYASLWVLLCLIPIVGVCWWFPTFLFVQSLAPRVLYLALPAWFGLVAVGVRNVTRGRSKLTVAMVVAGCVAVSLFMSVWTLAELARTRPAPFITFH